MITFHFLHPKATYEHLGLLPDMLSELSKDPAAVQFAHGYAHGGGWRPFSGFILNEDNSIQYPGDPPLKPLAQAQLRHETILVYPHAWVMILQPDRSFEICRMD